MKKILLFAAAAALLSSCAPKNQYIIEGNLAGVTGTVYLFDEEQQVVESPSDADIGKDPYAKRCPERIAAAVESERYIQGRPHLKQEIVSQPDGEAGTGEYAHHACRRRAWQCPSSIESCICMEWLRC